VVEESTLSGTEEGTFREGSTEEALRRCVRKRVLLGTVGERQSTAIAAIMRSPPSDSLHGVTEGAQVEQVGVEPEGKRYLFW
jgi:hypothetical protein